MFDIYIVKKRINAKIINNIQYIAANEKCIIFIFSKLLVDCRFLVDF